MLDSLALDAQTLGLPIANAAHLNERYQHLVDSLSTQDAPSMCDHSKTLLETVFRTIITDRNGLVTETPGNRASFVELYRQAIACLNTHDSDDEFLPIIKKSITVIATMRDNYGASSHGQDGYHEKKVEVAEAIFITRLSLAVAGYMYTRHVHTSADHGNSRLHYGDNSTFNNYLDSEGDIEVAGIFVPPSKILFDNDLIAYKEKLIEYENDVRLEEMEAAVDLWIETQSDIARGK